jgi:hypothetical protein
MSEQPRPRILIELEPLPDDVPAVVRLRMALKTLLRQYRFRAVAIRGKDGGEALLTEPPTKKEEGT